MDWGLRNRLSRILQPRNGRTVMLAVDHGYFLGPLTQLESPGETLRPLLPHADAIMLTRGVLRTSVDPGASMPVVLRVSGGSTIVGDNLANETITTSVRDAVRLNASAVALSIFVGSEYEHQTLTNLARLVDEGIDQGMPVLAVTAVGKELEKRDARYLGLCCRVAAEFGAHFVKTYHCEHFDKVVQGCPVPLVVAGGPSIRALPRYSNHFFDYTCTGDVEEIREVIEDAFGRGYVAEEMFPRFDLAYWMGRYGYVETSRNCNFRCTFCSLTADGHRYHPYPIDFIRRQILALGKRRFLIFIDNNFYGDNRGSFLARMELIQELYESGQIVGWGALVTNDFFLNEENLELARRAGCRALFSGVESFDNAVLRRFRKLQNTKVPQVEMIRRCLEAGIAFCYGIILDLTSRTLAELDAEIDFIVGNSEIPLPNYFSPVIPILQTPYFRECARANLLLPHTKLRDLDNTTLALRPLDPIDQVSAFLRDLPNLRRYRHRVPGHVLGFIRRYYRALHGDPMRIILGSTLMACAPNLSSGQHRWWNPRGRTFVTTTEPLGPLYTPAFRVDRRYETYFRPTMITDASGALRDALRADLLPTPVRDAAHDTGAIALER